MNPSEQLTLQTILIQSIPYVIGFLSALLVEPIRKKIFKPVLDLSFEDNLEYKTITPECTHMGDSKAYYIRVRVKNKSWYTAFGCRAHLVMVERKSNNKFEKTEFSDSLRLAWSCQPTKDEAFRAIDIPRNVNQFVDILSTRPNITSRSGSETIEKVLSRGAFYSTYGLETQVWPLRYGQLINQIGEYRYTILVTSDGADPKFIKLIFKWLNEWDKFEIRKG